MLCIDQLENMSLNGIIEEYEDYGQVVFDDEDILIGAIVVIGAAIDAFLPIYFNRLRGGESQIVNYSPAQGQGDVLMIPDEIYNLARRGAMELGGRAYNATVAAIERGKRKFDQWSQRQRKPKQPGKMPIADALRGGSTGASMLAWKNSLTRMYHTYQKYTMSPVMWTGNVGTTEHVKYVHRTAAGQGPALYWTYVTNTGASDSRNDKMNSLTYWDGGMDGTPSATSTGPPYVPKKNWGLGANGIVYIFAADWPGTVMNPDKNTYDTTSAYKKLEWIDYSYQGTVTTPNYPRTWASVFANTNWQYITVYGISYRFDVTNYSWQDYILEISMFKFKADVDAMDYEKQCLAHYGGYHDNMNGYVLKMGSMPIADINIINTKRYRITGNHLRNDGAYMIEGDKPNNRTIKMNIKKKLILKRPLVNSYQTDLTEATIFKTYYDTQKGIYLRMMAWPEDASIYSGFKDGIAGFYTNDILIPSSADVTTPPTRIGPALEVQMFRKAYFKLDENTTTF